jgi:hypothetical protein
MDWRGRIRELVLATGGAAVAALIPGCQCCNGNPDPCCEAPHSQACAEWIACEADGGRNESLPDPTAHCGEGTWAVHCVYPGDDLAIPCPAPVRDLGEND